MHGRPSWIPESLKDCDTLPSCLWHAFLALAGKLWTLLLIIVIVAGLIYAGRRIKQTQWYTDCQERARKAEAERERLHEKEIQRAARRARGNVKLMQAMRAYYDSSTEEEEENEAAAPASADKHHDNIQKDSDEDEGLGVLHALRKRMKAQ